MKVLFDLLKEYPEFCVEFSRVDSDDGSGVPFPATVFVIKYEDGNAEHRRQWKYRLVDAAVEQAAWDVGKQTLQMGLLHCRQRIKKLIDANWNSQLVADEFAKALEEKAKAGWPALPRS